jgi:hypothetical protein
MKSLWKVPKGLYRYNSSGQRLWVPHAGCVKGFQSLPSTTAEVRKQLSVIEKISPQNFWDTEHYMSVRNGLYHLPTKPLTEFHYSLLMAGWTEMPSLARKR